MPYLSGVVTGVLNTVLCLLQAVTSLVAGLGVDLTGVVGSLQTVIAGLPGAISGATSGGLPGIGTIQTAVQNILACLPTLLNPLVSVVSGIPIVGPLLAPALTGLIGTLTTALGSAVSG